MRPLVFLLFVNIAAFAQNVGDIAFDPERDNPQFKLCNPDLVLQGYQLKTKMDETSIAVEKEFRAKFKSNEAWKDQNGIIRIRFVVNCSGVADRFRVLQLGFDLKETKLNEDLVAHATTVAKGIPWPARRARQQTVDYYYHFSIHIVNGQLTDIAQ